MKPTTFTALTAALAITLTACSGSGDEEAFLDSLGDYRNQLPQTDEQLIELGNNIACPTVKNDPTPDGMFDVAMTLIDHDDAFHSESALAVGHGAIEHLCPEVGEAYTID